MKWMVEALFPPFPFLLIGTTFLYHLLMFFVSNHNNFMFIHNMVFHIEYDAMCRVERNNIYFGSCSVVATWNLTCDAKDTSCTASP
jgi:hypothetical protein